MNRYSPIYHPCPFCRLTPVLLILIVLTGYAAVQSSPEAGSAADCTSAECHGKLLRNPFVHEPAGAKQCDACHDAADRQAHTFELVTDKTELCWECHDEDEFPGDVEHAPVSQGQCLACHDPHGSPRAHLLPAPATELCSACHEDLVDGLEFLHGPAAGGACTACHRPHASEHSALLSADTRSLCLQCHEDIRGRLEGRPAVHDPARKACSTCHNPHGGANRMFLTASLPDLCIECHDDVAEQVEDAAVKHAVLQTRESCTACHEPHAAVDGPLLNKPKAALCLDCHEDSPRTAAMPQGLGPFLEENPVHHRPVQQQDCAACHNPHGGPHDKLLKQDYPANFYAAFDEQHYALCFECHDIEIFETQFTTDATAFRNGERNLHYLHVNRPLKGRTCRACHDPHAGKNAKLIAESVPFGKWRIPLGFKSTPGGGTCQPGCHRAYAYDRDQAVTNVTASAAAHPAVQEKAAGSTAK